MESMEKYGLHWSNMIIQAVYRTFVGNNHLKKLVNSAIWSLCLNQPNLLFANMTRIFNRT